MQSLRLVQIAVDGQPAQPVGVLSEPALEVCRSTAAFYPRAGFVSPWVGYLAIRDSSIVGTCAFKTPPVDGKVEIAYFTFPEFEGQGVATAMAQMLVRLARSTASGITVTAMTLPVTNASNSILKKLGFSFVGEVTDPEDGKIWAWSLVTGQPLLVA